METEIINARIENTNLGNMKDGTLFGFWLYLDFGGTGQGFGGYCLDEYDKPLSRRVGTAAGLESIIQILEIVGVDHWEDLKGKLIRVKRDAEWNGKIFGIGHVLKDQWFEPEAFFAEWREREAAIQTS